MSDSESDTDNDSVLRLELEAIELKERKGMLCTLLNAHVYSMTTRTSY
jgi:hypothetical protein